MRHTAIPLAAAGARAGLSFRGRFPRPEDARHGPAEGRHVLRSRTFQRPEPARPTSLLVCCRSGLRHWRFGEQPLDAGGDPHRALRDPPL